MNQLQFHLAYFQIRLNSLYQGFTTNNTPDSPIENLVTLVTIGCY